MKRYNLKDIEFINLVEHLHINGTMKPIWYEEMGYAVEVKGTKFFNPISCHYSFLLGKGNDKYRTTLGDERYKQIEQWLLNKIVPRVCNKSKVDLSSYEIKHICENAIGGYVSNETVKFILSIHKVPTVEVKDKYPINIRYYIQKKR